MKRELTLAMAAAAMVITSVSGCADDQTKTAAGGPSAVAPAAGGAPATAPGTRVIIDGKDQNVAAGQVVCSRIGGTINIGIGGQASGIAAVLTDTKPPTVSSVGLGNVNGVTLAYAVGAGGDASALQTDNGFRITGHATGINLANPLQLVTKPFEIDVVCP